MFDLRRQLFGRFRLMKQSVGFFTGRRTGGLLSRTNNHVGGIQDWSPTRAWRAIS